MDMKQAMRERHMVRKYTDRPLPDDIIGLLVKRVKVNNTHLHVGITLETNNDRAFSAVARLVLAKGVRNYFIMAGKPRPGLDESLGYAGADLMLYAQALGLNTWWVGGRSAASGWKRRCLVRRWPA